VAATNTADLNLLPEFIISRMRPQISIGFPPKEEIDDIIRDQCKGTRKEVERLIDLFWMLWMDHGGKIGEIVPRDAIYLFGWASKLSAFENAGGSQRLAEAQNNKPFPLLKEDHYTVIKPGHLEQAFQKLFSDMPLIKD